MSLYIDYDGKLTGGWYATNAKHAVIKASDRFTSGNTNFAENNIVFSGVRIVGNDENKTEYLAGTKDYAFNIEGNLLAQSDMNLSTLATELKTARCSLTYTPMSCTTHSFPHLRPLDIMKFETAQGTKKVVLTNVKWQSQNRCTKLEGKGETATQSGYATMGAFTPKQQAILEQTRAQQAAQINDYEQATLALNETIANSMGLYVTRKADSNGAVITYYHDKPTLEGSNTIYCRNAGGYAWTNNGWNNGSPNWEYGVSKDGDAVIRSIAANKISASYITTDILSSPTGKFSFNLDTGHIEASDINITGGDINLDGGQLSIENSGFKTDLSSGYLQMYYTTNMQTGANYEYFDINNTLIGTKFYATLAALKPAAALGVTSNGFRFGEKAENATLVNHWNTDYAVIEKDNARFRKKVEVNEPLSVAAGGDAIGFIAHAPNGANDVSAELGATSDASALLQIVNNTKGTIPARIEIYSSGTNGKGMTLKLTSGGGYTGRLFLDTTGLYAEFNDSGDYKKLA